MQALLQELALREQEYGDRQISSVYLGGGTPSLLHEEDLEQIFSRLRNTFDIIPNAEITLEVNPDDIHESILSVWRELSINRLSVGIQSFQTDALAWMNRAHSGPDALRALNLIAAAGFDNISADLIYGVPNVSAEQWEADIKELTDRQIPHLSAYCLTVEEHTALAHFVKKGISPPVQEEQANDQFDFLMEKLTEKGYAHYEISNFAKPGMEAKHNSSYWLGRHYLGFGPSAHSFNGCSRYWNVADNRIYTEALISGKMPPVTEEQLTEVQIYNEYVLTRLRTHWGINPEDISEPYRSIFLEEVRQFLPDMVYESAGRFRLTKKGKKWADYISCRLFADEKA